MQENTEETPNAPEIETINKDTNDRDAVQDNNTPTNVQIKDILDSEVTKDSQSSESQKWAPTKRTAGSISSLEDYFIQNIEDPDD